MELSGRKLAILHAIIDDYILTGVPVGSRTISKRSGMNRSTATIRNEMADLEEEGFLEQPHTSAGRLPSDKAYRLYVDMLMQTSQLNEQERRHIYSYFNVRMGELEQIIETTAKALSDMTMMTAVVMKPQLSKVSIKRIQLVKLAEARALVVFVLNTGAVKDVMIQIPPDTTPEYLEMLSNLLTERVEKLTLPEAAGVISGAFVGEMREQHELLAAVMEAAQTTASENVAKKVVLGGTRNIFNHPEYQNVEKAKGFLQLLETRESLFEMLCQAKDMEFSIRIGRENEIDELKDMSVVTATYRVGGKQMGSFGVIGPTRMNYARVISVLSCVRASMSEILGSLLEPPKSGE